VTAHEVVQAELRKHVWLRRLPWDDRREIEELAAAVAERVAALTAACDTAGGSRSFAYTPTSSPAADATRASSGR
jgi:hypothetical protein